MLEGEVFKIDFEGFEFINIDDNSLQEEVEMGKAICMKKNVLFLANEGRGVQMAMQTLMNFIKKERPLCKYVICFQHDVRPLTPNFFTLISELIDSKKLEDFGGIGFNVIDRGKYTFDAYSKWKAGGRPLGMLGLAHLSIASESKRWISPFHNPIAVKNPERWQKPFIIEFPAWMVVGLNVSKWNQAVIPTEEYQFHLWLPDVAMQLNRNNFPFLILPHLYCLNQQEIKSQYNIPVNSAHGAQNGHEKYFGKYSNFNAWKRRWGWEYRSAKKTFGEVKDRYMSTLLYQYYTHDITKGPLKIFE